ncbi:MAG: hypothetical protein KGL95_05420, partial [Patescibacteria group bacterium]|nr:hypothetical protein [Patescibacteria group bacterium]
EMLLANRAKQTKKKHSLRYRLFRKKYFFILAVVIFGYLNAYVYLTNPFHSVTIVKNPFTTSVENGKIILHKQVNLEVETNIFDEGFAYYKSAAHILANTYTGSKRAKDTTEQTIIQDIHALRFNPNYPYLISGDHFVVLYPRNLGVFYASILDPQTVLSEKDWEDRQRIYLQTTAYALDTFAKFHNLSTTIVPIGISSVTPINIYAYPSDSLYGVLYALNLMQTPNQYGQYHIQTITASRILTGNYMDSLKELMHVYQQTVFDSQSGLVRKDLHLSSARDSVIRESSFYDNVIYWKTLQLSSMLGITNISQDNMDQLKQRILKTFWNTKGGYFLNDLSGKSDYSSDWLIAYSTGFLNLSNEQDRAYAERAVTYLQKNGIDKPFGVKYEKETHATNEFFFVRYFVPNYGESAIWSHWGMEYVKLLIDLYKQTGNGTYKITAQKNLNAYEKNILAYQGYPEVYSTDGKFLENGIYKSIRQTGWVVNYEEAKFLLNQTQ